MTLISFIPARTRRCARFVAKRCVALWLLAAALGCGGASTPPSPGPAREHEVKATLLFNFCHFVDWPAHAFASESTPFVIGILGRDPFGKFIDDLVRDEKAHGRSIEVRRFSRVQEITRAHLVYVSPSEQVRIRGIVATLAGRPVLSVGEAAEPGFTRLGGMVEFTTDRDSMKLRINLDAARNAGLVISAKLLRLAEVARSQD